MSQAAIAASATTSVVDPHERADYWADLISTYQCRLSYKFPSRTDFQGHTRVRSTDAYQLVGWKSNAVTYLRSPKNIRDDPDDDYRLILPFAGHLTFRSDAGHGILTPGTMCLVAVDRPYTMSMSDGTQGLIITIPRQEIQHRLNRVAPPSHPLDLTTGLGRVTDGLVSGLYTECAALTDRQFDTVSERLVDLLCMQILGEPANSPTQLVDVEATARRYIHNHAGDPDLTGARVAGALGWSLRQIQLAFSTVGTTPSEVIREERLQLARDRLRSPAYQHRSISDIASDLGFGSASSFSKIFRRRFDTTPSQFREELAGHVRVGRTPGTISAASS
ncbi:AraC family transcriptional regulator [Nocardia sp. NBC_00565]|uniref:AraC family transcriptional regulator n=1 Tax=Nocardia sp. NBC_00565 TaxID=2975993 RepID=UPI002E80D87F|nr:AraC family transcriptional regulator [Nocardia sp. NBC_00565]WUC06097.1 AraC family transcriptional regulator [Nocardia sp. NBC_00565]